MSRRRKHVPNPTARPNLGWSLCRRRKFATCCWCCATARSHLTAPIGILADTTSPLTCEVSCLRPIEDGRHRGQLPLESSSLRLSSRQNGSRARRRSFRSGSRSPFGIMQIIHAPALSCGVNSFALTWPDDGYDQRCRGSIVVPSAPLFDTLVSSARTLGAELLAVGPRRAPSCSSLVSSTSAEVFKIGCARSR